MTREHGPSVEERVAAIRCVRLAAHDLETACAALTGGTRMALGKAGVGVLAEPLSGVVRGLNRRRKTNEHRQRD